MLVNPRLDYVVKEGEIIDGKCAGEVASLHGCDPLRRHECRPDASVPCEIRLSIEQQKLCELVDLFEGLDLELPESAGVTQIGCVRDPEAENPKLAETIGIVLACKNADGSLRYVMKPTDGGALIDPYDGPFTTDCGPPEFISQNCILNDPNSIYCSYPLFSCPPPSTDSYIFDTTLGWVLLDPTEHDLSAKFTPGSKPETKTDKEDLTPLKIVGPAAAADVSTLFADALAASSVTAFSQEGSDITEADVAECGFFSISEIDGAGGIVLNGDVENPLGAWSDDDGVNMANTFEVVDGFCALVNFCAHKEYTPVK